MDIINKREEVLIYTKQDVGDLCLKILSNPENNLGKLKNLISKLNHGEENCDLKFAYFSTQKLVAYSIVEIFKNILPDYEIEEVNDKNKDGKHNRINKEDYVLFKYEQSLLNIYKLFVDQLDKMVHLISKKKKIFKNEFISRIELRKNLSLVALECICELISNKPSFNFIERLISIAVSSMITSKLYEMQKVACESFKTLFQNDIEGNVSLFIVKEINKLVKKMGIAVEPQILELFLSLNIKNVNLENNEDKKSIKEIRENLSKMSRKERKHNKEMLKYKKDLVKYDIEQNEKKLANVHTQLLNQIFSIYFRVLKMAVLEIDNIDKFKNYSNVLSPVLEGLAQFAHLINVNFFEDVFTLLHQLLDNNVLTERQNFHCLITIFTIISGHGEVLNVDPQRFYRHFYKILISFGLNSEHKDIKMVLQCINIMIIRRKKDITTNRLLSFLKRFSTLTLSTSSEISLPLLTIIKYIICNFNKADILLDYENLGAGIFNAEVEDPEFCNASSTQLFELHLLKKHYNNLICEFSHFILNYDKSKINNFEYLRKTPIENFEEESKKCDEIILPENKQVFVSKKNKFHGYILDEQSLTQKSLKRIKCDNNFI